MLDIDRTVVITDGWPSYAGLERIGYQHIANIGDASWAREENSTNPVERTWSFLRNLIRTYSTIPPR